MKEIALVLLFALVLGGCATIKNQDGITTKKVDWSAVSIYYNNFVAGLKSVTPAIETVISLADPKLTQAVTTATPLINAAEAAATALGSLIQSGASTAAIQTQAAVTQASVAAANQATAAVVAATPSK